MEAVVLLWIMCQTMCWLVSLLCFSYPSDQDNSTMQTDKVSKLSVSIVTHLAAKEPAFSLKSWWKQKNYETVNAVRLPQGLPC